MKSNLFPTFSASAKRAPRREELQFARSHLSAIKSRMHRERLTYDQAFARVTARLSPDSWFTVRFITFDLIRNGIGVDKALRKLSAMIDAAGPRVATLRELGLEP